MIRQFFLWVSVGLLPATGVLAQSFPAERIISGASGDWNKDGATDLALLVAPGSEDEVIGIYLYVTESDRGLLKLVTSAPDKVWGNSRLDGFYGQDPAITALANGSIAVMSQNSAIGRNRWERTLTLAYREDRFIVAGYTYSYHDTLDLDDSGSCDYNVVTGKLKRDETAQSVAPRTVSIEDWTDEIGSKACGLL
ncbi:hypothetical protein [Ciceribacter selenitireducens]|uniref:hypothetical protein n=1 Tax=Ciceribacter selenitireducens TaxID=448181 RepID=UPI001F2BF0E7|nr:hypothetical protein [Ciceribacter selenitireducens]